MQLVFLCKNNKKIENTKIKLTIVFLPFGIIYIYLQMNMKHIAVLLLALLPLSASASVPPDSLRTEAPFWPRFQVGVSLGAAFGIHGEAPAGFVNNRARCELSFLVNYNPLRYVGIYADINFAGRDTKGPYADPDGVPFDYDECFDVLSMRGSVGIMAHLPLSRRFNLHGRVGYGFASGRQIVESYRMCRPLDWENKPAAWPAEWRYDGVPYQALLTSALSLEWCFHRHWGLVLDVGYRWPIKPVELSLIHLAPSPQPEIVAWRTRAWNRQLFISLGLLIK